MTSAAAWRWCLAAGVVAFACSVGFGHIPGLVACGDVGGLGPILAFEIARTPADIARLFGSEPCRSTLIAAQRTGLWFDALGFIPSYTAFLCLAAWATGHGWRRWIIAAALIAGVADEIEGVLLFAIIRELPGTPGLLDALFWPVRIKFVLLALGSAAIGMMIGKARPHLSLGLSSAAVISAASFFALIHLVLDPALMMAGFTVAWTTLLLVAAIGSVWPRLLASRPPAPASPSA